MCQFPACLSRLSLRTSLPVPTEVASLCGMSQFDSMPQGLDDTECMEQFDSMPGLEDDTDDWCIEQYWSQSAKAPVLDLSCFVCDDIANAAKTLDDHGFVVFPSTLGQEAVEDFLAAMQAVDGNGLSERDPLDGTHYSYNTCSDLPIEFYRLFQSDGNLCTVVSSLLSKGWKFGSMGGDVVLANSPSAQELHSDWGKYATSCMKYSYALVASIALHDIDVDMAAIRFVPWSCEGYKNLPYLDKDEAGNRIGYCMPMRAGDILLRDCRCAHSGMPNSHGRDRVLPG